jgi:hypothetical protein
MGVLLTGVAGKSLAGEHSSGGCRHKLLELAIGGIKASKHRLFLFLAQRQFGLDTVDLLLPLPEAVPLPAHPQPVPMKPVLQGSLVLNYGFVRRVRTKSLLNEQGVNLCLFEFQLLGKF